MKYVRSSAMDAMDVLSDMLQAVRLQGGVYFRCEFSAPWGMEVPEHPSAEFHVIASGHCWLGMGSDREPIRLLPGDVVVFLNGAGHRLLDDLAAQAVPAEQIVAGQCLENFGPVRFGGGGTETSILCGYFRFDRQTAHPLLAALPPFIHLRGTDVEESSALQTVVHLMQRETRSPRPGAEVVVNRLCEVLFIQIIRAYLEQARIATGVLAALADAKIGAALALLHRSPDKPWTLETLARQVGMSRSAFATRFNRLVGQTPMQYLTHWRMEVAGRLLRETRRSAADIAERVGYRSEAAFGKVFKRTLGIGPGAYRRQTALDTSDDRTGGEIAVEQGASSAAGGRR